MSFQALAIPFQSKFNDHAQLNDKLVELGTVKDIFSAHAGDESNLSISFHYWLGAQGEYIYEVLTDLTNKGERLHQNDKRILKEDEGPTVRRNIINWMAEISPGFNFESDSVNYAEISHAQFQAYGSSKTSPLNMGFGLSYSLGIVCALLLRKLRISPAV